MTNDVENICTAIMGDFLEYDRGDAGHSFRNEGWQCSYCFNQPLSKSREGVAHAKGCAVLSAERLIEERIR